MDVLSLSVVLVVLVGWCFLAGRLGRSGLTAPILFVMAGFVLTQVGLLDLAVEHHLVKVVAEVTLVWVLFGDASQVRLRQVRRDLGAYVRLLAIGLPLTVALGTVAAVVLLGVDWWAALLIGAALAPTDAALGASVLSNPRVPAPIRRMLNVESGLNDGIVTPIVLVAIAGVAAVEGIAGAETPGHAALALLIGVLAGAVVGSAGGGLSRLATARGWLSELLAGPAVVALALLAYTAALVLDGNGFVAAFVGGFAFRAVAGRRAEEEVVYVEQSSSLASMITWLIFGALAVPALVESFSWAVLGYAAICLTVVRMLPVALAMVGSGLDRYGVAFVGWFGPRGLASVVFALLALEDLGGAGEDIAAVIASAVLLSVLAHGLSAGPLSGRFPAEHHVSPMMTSTPPPPNMN